MESYKGGIIKTGPDCYVRFYKKNQQNWEEQWRLSISVPFENLHVFAHQHVIACDSLGTVQAIVDDSNEPQLQLIRRFDRFVL